jgi:hypothetical protein
MSKTYNSGDSLVVTHLTTNPPVHCLYMAERTGSLTFSLTTATKAPNFPVYGKLDVTVYCKAVLNLVYQLLFAWGCKVTANLNGMKELCGKGEK